MKRKCTAFLDCKEEKTVYLEKNGFLIKECKVCGHRFAKIPEIKNHIKDVYSDDYFLAGKQGYPNYLNEKDILIKSGIKYAKLLSKYASPGKVLDVGCAAGFILKGFEQSGWECFGLEPNYTMASFGRNELNLDIVTGNLESFETSERFHLINMIQVIGHFINLDEAFKNLSRLLIQNGLVLVESWDMASGYAKLMGKNWHEYSPPSVINWFSDNTMIQLFNHYNFELVAKGRPSKRINIKHGLSLFDEITPEFFFKKKFINFFKNTIGKYNIIYPPLDVKWYLFKKM